MIRQDHNQNNLLITCARAFTLTCAIALLSAPSMAQLYVKKDKSNSNTTTTQKKSLFLKNKSTSNSNVYTPPATTGRSSSYNQNNSQTNSKSNYKATVPRSTNNNTNQRVTVPHKCSDKEYQIYKKMAQNMTKFTNLGQNAFQKSASDDNITFTYSKEDQAFLDSFQTSFDKMLINPSQRNRYYHIMSECGYRHSLKN